MMDLYDLAKLTNPRTLEARLQRIVQTSTDTQEVALAATLLERYRHVVVEDHRAMLTPDDEPDAVISVREIDARIMRRMRKVMDELRTGQTGQVVTPAAAEERGLGNAAYLRQLATAGKIPGAVKSGKSWLLPLAYFSKS